MPFPIEPILLALLADGLLLRRHRAAPRAFPRAGVRVRTLSSHREIAAVTDSTVRLDFDQPADIHLDLLAEIAFHAALFFNFLPEMIHFVFGQVADLLRVIDARLRGELSSALLPDAVNRSQTDPKALLRRKVNTCDACHSFSLTLALLVLRINANNPHHATPVDHLAFVTNLFYRCPYFHFACPSLRPRFAISGSPPKARPLNQGH